VTVYSMKLLWISFLYFGINPRRYRTKQ